MSNQTLKNEENNRGENIKNEAISSLRPLWLGIVDAFQEISHNLRQLEW